MATDEDVRKDFDGNYTYSINNWRDFLVEADTDTLFYLGKQWANGVIEDLAEEGRSAYVFNYCQRNIHLTTGHQIKNRKGIGCKAVNKNDELVADILNGVMINVNSTQGVYDVISECFEDQVICGLSMATLYMDYTDDIISGDVKILSEPFQSFMIDPKWSRIDLSDCGFILKRKFLNEHELKVLHPGINKDDVPQGIPDQKFQYQSMSQANSGQPIYAYDEMWQRTSKVVDGWVDMKTGKVGIWGGPKSEFKLFMQLNPTKKSVKRVIPSVKYFSMVGREILYEGDELSGIGDYPQIPFVGVYKPQVGDFKYKLHGMIRPARDPQENYNKIRSMQDDIIKSGLYATWLIDEGAMKNPEDALTAGTGKVLVKKKGAPDGSIVRLPHAEPPQALAALSQQLNVDMIEIPGLSDEALGVADAGNTEISATLAKQRNANSLTVLQKYFSNLEKSENQIGRKELRMIQVNYTDEKIAEITEMEITKEISLALRDPYFNKNIIVTEQDLTDTQRNLTYMQAVHAKQIIGDEFPNSIIIDRLPITEKVAVREAFDEQRKLVAEKKETMQEQEEIQKRLINAEIVHKLSLAEQQRETAVSRQMLAVQHLENAHSAKAKALLDNVKAVKELQGIDQERLIQGMSFLLELQEREKQQDLAVVKGTSQQAEKDILATNQMNSTQGQPEEQLAKLSSLF